MLSADLGANAKILVAWVLSFDLGQYRKFLIKSETLTLQFKIGICS